ncbi:hypothetical protein EDB84DRAFT_1456099 [Lactarius hengduanensis]|nr:hypothetical protein EDB84DRAFT_1456099 [Lactarius hengduanensis]
MRFLAVTGPVMLLFYWDTTVDPPDSLLSISPARTTASSLLPFWNVIMTCPLLKVMGREVVPCQLKVPGNMDQLTWTPVLYSSFSRSRVCRGSTIKCRALSSGCPHTGHFALSAFFKLYTVQYIAWYIGCLLGCTISGT